MRIIIATGNQHKVREFKEILEGFGLPVISMKEAGLVSDPEETGTTFAENAAIKARALGVIPDSIVIADDSGLVIDALGGEPGIYSSRYLGEDTSYDLKMRTLIARLEGTHGSERACRFVAAMHVIFPDGEEYSCLGTMEGLAALEPAGCGGFGYDPMVYLPEWGKTSAELTEEEKNSISHRGHALQKVKVKIGQWLEEKA